MTGEATVLEHDLRRDEFDLYEFFQSFCELIGLVLIVVVTHDPADFVHICLVTTHLYAMVQVPLSGRVQVVGTVIRTTVRRIR